MRSPRPSVSLVGQFSDVVGGFSQMYSRAAIASASRVAASSPPPLCVDLVLTSPRRASPSRVAASSPRPVAFDEDVSDASPPPPGEDVSFDEDVSHVAPVASGGLTPSVRGVVRPRGLPSRRGALQSAFASSSSRRSSRDWNGQDVRSRARAIVPEVPKSPSPVSARPGVRWSYV